MSVLGFGDCLRGSQDLVYTYYHGYDLLLWKDTKQSQLREKVCRTKPGGNQVQASKSLLPLVTQDILHSFSSELWQYLWNVDYKGGLLEI